MAGEYSLDEIINNFVRNASSFASDFFESFIDAGNDRYVGVDAVEALNKLYVNGLKANGKLMLNNMFLGGFEFNKKLKKDVEWDLKKMILYIKSVSIPGIERKYKTFRTNKIRVNRYVMNGMKELERNNIRDSNICYIDEVSRGENFINSGDVDNNYTTVVGINCFGAYDFERTVSINFYVSELGNLFYRMLDYIRRYELGNNFNDLNFYIFLLNSVRLPIGLVRFFNVNFVKVDGFSLSMDGGDLVESNCTLSFEDIEYRSINEKFLLSYISSLTTVVSGWL